MFKILVVLTVAAVGAGDDRGQTVGRLRGRAAARSYLEGGSSTTVLVELRASSGAKEKLQSVQQGLVDTEGHQLK